MSSFGLSASAAGARAQSERIDRIAQNLAHASTPGYRREATAFRARLGEALALESAASDEAGRLEATGRPLDLALRSRGFFAVEDPLSGRVYYTRAGQFSLDAQGRLVTPDGRFRALGVALDPAGGEPRVRPDGTFVQGETEAGRLAVADFPPDAPLRKAGASLYEDGGAVPSIPEDVRVEQGSLEGSSVNPVLEMAAMIRALRAFEANLQMIRFQDAALDRAVNDFARVSR